MRRFIVLGIAIMLLMNGVGCAWTAAKTLTPEQLQGMKEIMSIEKVAGCFGAGGGAAFATAEFQLRGGVCKGFDKQPTISEILLFMHGIPMLPGPPAGAQ